LACSWKTEPQINLNFDLIIELFQKFTLMRIFLTFFSLCLIMASCIVVDPSAISNGGGVVLGGPVPGYTGRVGCNAPITNNQFQRTRQNLASYSSSFDRMDVAKAQIPREGCYTVSQIRQLVTLWSSSFDREEFLHFAYDYTYDIDNYVDLQDVFTSSIDRKEFVEWCYNR